MSTPLIALFIDVRPAIRLPLMPTMAINIVNTLQGSLARIHRPQMAPGPF